MAHSICQCPQFLGIFTSIVKVYTLLMQGKQANLDRYDGKCGGNSNDLKLFFNTESVRFEKNVLYINHTVTVTDDIPAEDLMVSPPKFPLAPATLPLPDDRENNALQIERESGHLRGVLQADLPELLRLPDQQESALETLLRRDRAEAGVSNAQGRLQRNQQRDPGIGVPSETRHRLLLEGERGDSAGEGEEADILRGGGGAGWGHQWRTGINGSFG